MLDDIVVERPRGPGRPGRPKFPRKAALQFLSCQLGCFNCRSKHLLTLQNYQEDQQVPCGEE